MQCIIVYDINTMNDNGRVLRLVRKECLKFGYPVQNSVFELDLNKTDLVLFKNSISKLLRKDLDSVIMYYVDEGVLNKADRIGSEYYEQNTTRVF